MASEIQSHSGFFDPVHTYRVIQKPNAQASSTDDLIREFLLSRSSTPVKNRRVRRPKVFPTGGKLIQKIRKEFTQFGQELKRIPAQFGEDVRRFVNYLSDTAKIFFKITNRYVFKDGNEVTEAHKIPYIHRWTDIYRKSILAKLYQLEEALTPEQLSQVTLITLTVSQRHKDQEDCLRSLMKNYTKMMDVLRHKFGAVDYFYILEPHKTGYVHMHLVYMKLLNNNDKRWIVSTWENRYGAGSHKGFNFSEPKASQDGSCEAGKISHFRSYVMKYLSKGLRSETMSNQELLFNALLKKTGIRLWNCSRNFSRIMKAPINEDSEALAAFECLCVELFDGSYEDEADGFISQIYPKSEHNYKSAVSQLIVISEPEPKRSLVPKSLEPGSHKKSSRKQKKVYTGHQERLDTTLDEDYGDVEGVSVIEDGEEMLRFLKDEGY